MPKLVFIFWDVCNPKLVAGAELVADSWRVCVYVFVRWTVVFLVPGLSLRSWWLCGFECPRNVIPKCAACHPQQHLCGSLTRLIPRSAQVRSSRGCKWPCDHQHGRFARGQGCARGPRSKSGTMTFDGRKAVGDAGKWTRPTATGSRWPQGPMKGVFNVLQLRC